MLLRINLLLLNVMVVSFLFISSSNGQETETDQGATDILSQTRQLVGEQMESAKGVFSKSQRVSAMKVYEQQLRKVRKRVSKEKYFRSMQEVGVSYWENLAYADASRVFDDIQSKNPDNLLGVEANYMLGLIQYGNKGKPLNSIEPFERAVTALESISGKNNPVRNELAGRVFITLGDVYMVTGQYPEAIERYEAILDDKGIVETTEPRTLLNANLELARIFLKLGKGELARKHFLNAEEYIDKSDLPESMKISLFLESWRAQIPKMTKDKSIEFLEEIWHAKKRANAIEILHLGNDLSIFYYLSDKEKYKNKFLTHSLALIEVANRVKKKNKSLNRNARKDLRSIYGQTILMRVDRLTHDKKKTKAEKAVSLFREEFEKERRILFSPFVPTHFPRSVAVKMIQLHDKYIKKLKIKPGKKIENKKKKSS